MLKRKNKFRRLRCYLLTCVLICSAGWAGFESLGTKLIFNVTQSLPDLIYLRVEGKIERGDIAAACPPDQAIKIGKIMHSLVVQKHARTLCAYNTNPVLKIVAAVPGDLVSADGINPIKINGKPFVGSAPLPTSILPKFKYHGTLPDGAYLLLTHYYDGYDGRYFGLISGNSLIGKYRPLF